MQSGCSSIGTEGNEDDYVAMGQVAAGEQRCVGMALSQLLPAMTPFELDYATDYLHSVLRQ